MVPRVDYGYRRRDLLTLCTLVVVNDQDREVALTRIEWIL